MGSNSIDICEVSPGSYCARMAEQEKTIPIPGTDKVIRGLLRDRANTPMVVMLHCFTGNKNCLEMYIGARTFESAGISSFRFDMYGSGPDQRKFLDTTLDTHVHDLGIVMDALRSEFPNRKIGVIGHSIGGAVILASGGDFDAAVLWDATHGDWWEGKQVGSDDYYEWIPSLGLYRTKGGVEELVTRDYLESYQRLPSNDLIAKLHCPVLVLMGDDGDERWYGMQQSFFEHANNPKEFVAIEGANHLFDNDESMVELHQRTIDWLYRTL